MHLSSATMQWLSDCLKEADPPSDLALDYLEGRGMSQDLIEKAGVKTWLAPSKPCPDQGWNRLYGPYGEIFEGKIVAPIWTARGELLGVEYRSPFKKDFHRLVAESSRWNPLWMGMPWTMPLIWNQRRVALVEGYYDAVPLWRAYPDFPVLACNTASVSRTQRIFLSRFVDEVWFVYDNDPAGHKGAQAAEKSLFRTHKVRLFVDYGRKGDDPGKVWDRGGLTEVKRVFSFLEV